MRHGRIKGRIKEKQSSSLQSYSGTFLALLRKRPAIAASGCEGPTAQDSAEDSDDERANTSLFPIWSLLPSSPIPILFGPKRKAVWVWYCVRLPIYAPQPNHPGSTRQIANCNPTTVRVWPLRDKDIYPALPNLPESALCNVPDGKDLCQMNKVGLRDMGSAIMAAHVRSRIGPLPARTVDVLAIR